MTERFRIWVVGSAREAVRRALEDSDLGADVRDFESAAQLDRFGPRPDCWVMVTNSLFVL